MKDSDMYWIAAWLGLIERPETPKEKSVKHD